MTHAERIDEYLFDQVLNARIRIVGGRNNPDPEEAVQFFTETLNTSTSLRRAVGFGSARLGDGDGTHSAKPFKIEVSRMVESYSHRDAEASSISKLNRATKLILCL